MAANEALVSNPNTTTTLFLFISFKFYYICYWIVKKNEKKKEAGICTIKKQRLSLYLANSVQKYAEENVEDNGGSGHSHHRVGLHLELVRVQPVDGLHQMERFTSFSILKPHPHRNGF